MGVGFYGKLPMRGDFVGRSLARDFIQPWDEWLQRVMLAGQSGLQEAWPGHYLNSPIWHFALGAGLCGPAAMIGVMIASADAVGRYFPLTVAAPLQGRPAPALTALAAAEWGAAAEAVVLRALDPDIAFADFESAVAGLAAPGEAFGEIGPGAATTLIEAGLAPSLLRITANPAASRSSLWWTEGTPDMPGVSLCLDGLPSPQQAVVLFDGQWERWGMRPMINQDRPPQPANEGLRIESAARTHVGKVRRINEDACLERVDIGLWAVADGVGGWHAGDRASGLVVELLGAVENSGPGAALLAEVFERLEHANAQLLREAETTGRPSATTVVALLISGRYFACVWAGDSRLYLWRAGQLRQLTRDHTEAQALVDAGLMTLEEAERRTNRNAIARAVGAAEKLELDMLQDAVEDGDVFLLCTDGLTKMLRDEEIAATLAGAHPQAAVESLLDLSLERGAVDNVTIVAVRLRR